VAQAVNSSSEKTLSSESMRSAWVTGANSVVCARPPTVCVGLSWPCNSGNMRSSSSSRRIIASYSSSEASTVSRS
jgi:hypothetical protein